MQMVSLVIGASSAVIMFSLLNDLIFVWLGIKFVLSIDILAAIICNFYLANTYFWYEPNLFFKNYFEEKVGEFYISILKNIVRV